VVRAAAMLVMVGAVLAGVAVFLPWLSIDGVTQTGTGVFVTTDFELYDSPGSGVLFVAAVLLGLGIALYVADRVLAVAIIAVVFASIALIVAIAMIGIVSDAQELAGDGTLGVGVFALVPAAALALGGSIWATSRRRRW
jgi:hypothetical protein